MKSNSVEHYPWNTKPAWLGSRLNELFEKKNWDLEIRNNFLIDDFYMFTSLNYSTFNCRPGM